MPGVAYDATTMLLRCWVFAVVALLAGISTDLDACGDKFLNLGRSARFQGYQAIHPASILIYRSPKSTDKGIKEFASLLKSAGHQTVVIRNGDSVSRATATHHYDVIIAEYTDAPQVTQQLRSTGTATRVLPVLNKPTPQVEKQADSSYSYVIKPHAMDKYEALALIDRVMTLASNDRTVPSTN